MKKNIGVTYIKWEIDIVLFTLTKTLESFLSPSAIQVNPAFLCQNLAVRVEDIDVLSASQTAPGTPLSRLAELILIRNKKKTDGSTANIILWKSRFHERR